MLVQRSGFSVNSLREAIAAQLLRVAKQEQLQFPAWTCTGGTIPLMTDVVTGKPKQSADFISVDVSKSPIYDDGLVCDTYFYYQGESQYEVAAHKAEMHRQPDAP